MNPPVLAFNFLPVRFSADDFKGGLIEFESPEQLADLRAKLGDSHVVAKTRTNIACIPVQADTDVYGTPTTFRTRDHRSLTMRLVQEALLRSVLGWGYKVRRLSPPAFVSRLAGRDLLEPSVRGRRQEALGRLHVYPEYRLDSRTIGPSNHPGVIVGVKSRYEIDMTVDELIHQGLDVRGRYVLSEDAASTRDPRMDHHAARQAVGAVDHVDGTDLVLRDAPGVTRISASNAWLESRRETFDDVVRALAGADSSRILKELDQKTFDLLGAFGRYEGAVSIASRLERLGQLQVAGDLSVAIEPPVGSSSGRKVSGTYYQSPTFQFDQAGDKTSRSPDRGLDEYGPFDVEFFAKKKPRIAVITPRAHKGVVENFLFKFLHGIQGERTFGLGFIRKYHLSGCDVSLHPFDGATTDANAYREACRRALLSGDIDLAIVITSEDQAHLTGDNSPYLVAKSAFMGQGVPVQDVRVETVRLGKLAHPLNSIALACYAKLGGIPFVIAAPRSLTHELVIGIGSAHVKESRLTAPERVVGITTVFSADGNYLLSNTSREADYDDYPRELLRSLTECIDAIKIRNAWQKGDELRLIFHVFKPLKDIEAAAVKELVERLTRTYAKVEFAFVHVSTDHDWAMFDRASAGVNRGASGRAKGHYVPERGHAVPIGQRELLVAVSGPMDLKSALHGAPKPLLLKLHRHSTFTDIEYLGRQAFRFTAMSWRNMYPSRIPVTILYSDLIAELLGQLRHVRNWNADAVATKLRSSRWFL
ncbi:argonaute/piwi family protein [Streptomyces longwoodensis]|uniref:argonaute/piwi family protein n=1 Tax=Streptomyces longwoodensis TaxID=68231 RepID=UPI00099E4C75|nr:Piwi domain-containing protein [Streptomyces longwoodensis]